MWQLKHPEFLHLLWSLLLLWAALAAYSKFQKTTARRLGLPGNQDSKLFRTLLWSISALLFMIVALVNPQKPGTDLAEKSFGADVVLVLDISNSMLANDVAPNRLEQARAFSIALIEQLGDSRMALIPLAGTAWIQIPLTTDLEAIKMGVLSVHPRLAPQQGSSISDAITLSASILEKASPNSKKAIVLVSDGENHGESLRKALRQIKKTKLFTCSVGVGTKDGGFMPIESTEGNLLKKDADGKPVRTFLQDSNLKRLSPGNYHKLNSFKAQQLAEGIASKILNAEEIPNPKTNKTAQTYYQVFLALALGFLALGLWWENRPRTHLLM